MACTDVHKINSIARSRGLRLASTSAPAQQDCARHLRLGSKNTSIGLTRWLLLCTPASSTKGTPCWQPNETRVGWSSSRTWSMGACEVEALGPQPPCTLGTWLASLAASPTSPMPYCAAPGHNTSPSARHELKLPVQRQSMAHHGGVDGLEGVQHPFSCSEGVGRVGRRARGRLLMK